MTYLLASVGLAGGIPSIALLAACATPGQGLACEMLLMSKGRFRHMFKGSCSFLQEAFGTRKSSFLCLQQGVKPSGQAF